MPESGAPPGREAAVNHKEVSVNPSSDGQFGDSVTFLSGWPATQERIRRMVADIQGETSFPITDQWIPHGARELSRWPRMAHRLYRLDVIRQQTCGSRNWAKAEIAKVPTPKGSKAAAHKKLLRTLAESYFHGVAFERLLDIRAVLIFIVTFLACNVVLPAVSRGLTILTPTNVAIQLGAAALTALLISATAVVVPSRLRYLISRLTLTAGLFAVSWITYYSYFQRVQSERSDLVLISLVGYCSVVISAYVGSSISSYSKRRRHDPAADIVGSSLDLLHLMHQHPDEWSRSGFQRRVKESFLHIAGSVSAGVAMDIERQQKPRQTRTGREISAYIDKESDAVFEQNGKRAAIVLAQSCVNLASQRAWLSFPKHPVEIKTNSWRGQVRSVLSWLVIVGAMAVVDFTKVLSPSTENWAWVLVVSYVGISLISKLDPDFESRLTMVGNALNIFGKRQQILQKDADEK